MCSRFGCDDCELCLIPYRIMCDAKLFPIIFISDSDNSDNKNLSNENSGAENDEYDYIHTQLASYRSYKLWDFVLGICDETDSKKEQRLYDERIKYLKEWFDEKFYLMSDKLDDEEYNFSIISKKIQIAPNIKIQLKLYIIPLKKED